MFKFFSRTRDRSSGHLKDKQGQDLLLFNKVWFWRFSRLSLWIECNSRDMCSYKYPQFLAGCRTRISTETLSNRSRFGAKLVGCWNKQWTAENVSFGSKTREVFVESGGLPPLPRQSVWLCLRNVYNTYTELNCISRNGRIFLSVRCI